MNKIVRRKLKPRITEDNVADIQPVEQVVEQQVEIEQPKKDFRLNIEGVREPQIKMNADMERTGRLVNAEEKVGFYFPLGINEQFGAEQSCKINGYQWLVKKGMSLMLPKTLAEMLQNRVDSENGRKYAEYQKESPIGFGKQVEL